MVTSVLIRTQVSRKGSFPLDSVSVRVPGVEMLYIIYVQFGEGVIHAPKPDFRWSGEVGQRFSFKLVHLEGWGWVS